MLNYNVRPLRTRCQTAVRVGSLGSLLSNGSSTDLLPCFHTKLSVMGAPPDGYQKPQGFSVTLGLKDAAQAERIFHTLAENGTVQMPLQETFWAARFDMLVDRFGIP